MITVIEETMCRSLEDDVEVMTSALDSDLDAENKRLNSLLIKKQKEVIKKIKTGKTLSKDDKKIIKDANEIHVNDESDFCGFHNDALDLDVYLKIS